MLLKDKFKIFVLGLVALAAAGIAAKVYYSFQPGRYDDFAKCLADKEALFYGAYWCPHCLNQKKMFGNSEKYLPYIECSTPGKKDQLPVCTSAGIKSYPTWVFADGFTETGEVPFAKLAEKTGCILPE